jgi:hypothetical protein
VNADGYLVDPATGEKLAARSFEYDDATELDQDERMNIAEQLVEDREPADATYLFVTVDFGTGQLFCDRVAVECETSWSVVPAV